MESIAVFNNRKDLIKHLTQKNRRKEWIHYFPFDLFNDDPN